MILNAVGLMSKPLLFYKGQARLYKLTIIIFGSFQYNYNAVVSEAKDILAKLPIA